MALYTDMIFRYMGEMNIKIFAICRSTYVVGTFPLSPNSKILKRKVTYANPSLPATSALPAATGHRHQKSDLRALISHTHLEDTQRKNAISVKNEIHSSSMKREDSKLHQVTHDFMRCCIVIFIVIDDRCKRSYVFDLRYVQC